MTHFTRTFLKCALPLVAAFSIAPAAAQVQTQVSGSGWSKVCSDQNESKLCSVQFRVATNNGQVLTAVNLINMTGKIERRVFQIAVPTARSLPAGIEIQVDNKQKATIPYAFCRPQVCVAEAPLNDDLVRVFKAGGELRVTTTNFQGTKNPIPVTLKGFTAAYDGPPVKPKETIETSQEKLKKQLEDRVKAGQIKAE